MVNPYRKVSINNLEFKVPAAPLHDLSAPACAGHGRQVRSRTGRKIQLRIITDKESGISEVRFWYKDEFLGSQKVRNSDLNLVQV